VAASGERQAAQRGRAADGAPGPAARRTALWGRGRAAGVAPAAGCALGAWASGGRRYEGGGGAADGAPGSMARRTVLRGRWRAPRWRAGAVVGGGRLSGAATMVVVWF
jgi:hypothetical protein